MTDWERLVREHGPGVYRTAWRVLGHAADAEDVVQDVFLEAQRVRVAVRSWGALLRRLATFRALDRLRQRKPAVSFDELNLPSQNGEPASEAIGRELAERLRQAVAELPEREASVFCQRYFDDLSYDQIAENLAISRGAVASALHKARSKLEAMLIEVCKE